MSGSALNRFDHGGEGVVAHVGKIVRAMVLAIWDRTLTEILWIVDCIDRLRFRSSGCVETLSLSHFILRHRDPVAKASSVLNPDRRFYHLSLLHEPWPRFAAFPTGPFVDPSSFIPRCIDGSPRKLVLDCPCSSRV